MENGYLSADIKSDTRALAYRSRVLLILSALECSGVLWSALNGKNEAFKAEHSRALESTLEHIAEHSSAISEHSRALKSTLERYPSARVSLLISALKYPFTEDSCTY